VQKITEDLLKCGATVNEINTVRKHISEFKGGKLAEKLHPATILNLVISDVVGDKLDTIASGPTVPDFTTFCDSIHVLKKYGLWTKVPSSIRAVLSDGKRARIPEIPKADSSIFKKVFNVILGNNQCASLAAYNYLKSAGLSSLLLTSVLEGESKHVGTVLASIAHEFSLHDYSIEKPVGIVVGGETTVTVTGEGIGGRNQEMVLAATLKLKGLKNVVVASLNTDGIDGPTKAAGAIADGYTLERSKKMGCIPEDFLAENDSHRYFSKLDDLIFTGITGTNVNDVAVLVIL
jgi:glycerate-2-kinase